MNNINTTSETPGGSSRSEVSINGWRYYNRAAMPTTPPTQDPDTSPISDGTIWNLRHRGKTPLMAVWTTDYDCGQDTGWYYVIREAPFDLNTMTGHYRQLIRRALRLCSVKKIKPSEYADELYNLYAREMRNRYGKDYNPGTLEAYRRGCIANNNREDIDYWAGFSKEGLLIGFMVITLKDDHIDISSAFFWAEYQRLRVSEALYATVLDYYLNHEGKAYVDVGSRNLNHATNAHEYRIQHFQFRKVFCRLHLIYHPKIRPFVKILRLFRPILRRLDHIQLVHEINAVLAMEDISRTSQHVL